MDCEPALWAIGIAALGLGALIATCVIGLLTARLALDEANRAIEEQERRQE